MAKDLEGRFAVGLLNSSAAGSSAAAGGGSKKSEVHGRIRARVRVCVCLCVRVCVCVECLCCMLRDIAWCVEREGGGRVGRGAGRLKAGEPSCVGFLKTHVHLCTLHKFPTDSGQWDLTSSYMCV